MPQDGPLSLLAYYTGYGGYPQAYHHVAVEDECGYSSVSIHAVVVPVGRVWTFGSKATSIVSVIR
jgi:hypothetical protein